MRLLPDKMLCYVDPANIKHAVVHAPIYRVVHAPIYQWKTLCDVLIGDVPMKELKYDQPSCLGCLVNEMPRALPRDSDKQPLSIKQRFHRRGHHVYSTVFIGPTFETLRNAGQLVMDYDEFQKVGTALTMGCHQLSHLVQATFEEEGPPHGR